MILHHKRKEMPIEAWKVPIPGQVCDEPMPMWLTRAMNLGRVYISSSGTFHIQSIWTDERLAFPGWYVVRHPTGVMEAFSSHRLNKEYE